MCKTPKPKPIQTAPPEVLHNPFTDGGRGVVGAYFARRIGRASLRINRGGSPVLLTHTGLTYDPTQATPVTPRPIGPRTDLPNVGSGLGRGGQPRDGRRIQPV